MPEGGIVREWVIRPDFAASDWPAGDLREQRTPLPVAVRVRDAANVVGLLTLITPTALQIDVSGAVRQVPLGVVRAYAILEGLIEYSGSLLG